MSRPSPLQLAPGPHQEVALEQRRRLLEAMADVVSTAGYETTTVEQVLVQAGISRKTFYELFSNKEDCFVTAYEEAMARVIRTISEAYLSCGRPELRIEAALDAFLQLCADEPDLARLCVIEVFAAGPRARECRARAMERLAALMEHALAQLRGDEKLDRLTSQALVGGVHELIYTPVERRDGDALRGMAKEIVATQIAPLVEVAR